MIRCLILALIAYSVDDGLQYRELKSALNVSDGKLIANLNRLLKMGYIYRQQVRLDRRQLNIFTLTDEGKKELETIMRWIESFQRVAILDA